MPNPQEASSRSGIPNATFTPGPWEYSASDPERHAVVSPPVDSEHDFGPWFTAIISCADDGIETANARLIAAAPELYAACEAMKKAIESAVAGDYTFGDLWHEIDTALAKADGTQ